MSRRRQKNRNNRARPGLTLVLVLWIVALLSVSMYGALVLSRTEYSLTNTFEDEEKLRQIALSGIDFGIASLLEDATPYDTMTDDWFNNETLFKEVPLGEGTFSLVRPEPEGKDGFVYGIQDEASRLNLNTAAMEHFKELKPLDEAMASAIIDWRDEDEEALGQGAEDGYYLALTPPYKTKNAPYETLEELLYVKDITPAILYGKDRNVNGKVDGSEIDDAVATTDFGIYRWVTPYSSEPNLDINGKPRVNLNTASDPELVQVLQVSFTPQKQQIVLNWRRNNKFQTAAQVCGLFQGNTHINRPELQPVYDQLTVTDDKRLVGLVNVNTAPEFVLRTLAGLTPAAKAAWPNGVIPPQNVTEDELKKIIEIRKAGGARLASASWVEDVLDDPKFRTFGPFITTKSRQYRIDVVARLTDKTLYKRYQAVVDIDRENSKARIIYFRDISHRFMKAWE